ncbi:YsgD/CorL family protein, partial [Enterobacter hormaechei]
MDTPSRYWLIILSSR